MFTASRLIAAAGTAVAAGGLAFAPAAAPAAASPPPAYQRLAGSTVPFTARAVPAGVVPGGAALTIQVWLAPRLAAAERYATAVSTPGSGQFRRYLSPAAYAARFAASPGQAATVRSWLRGAGFTGVRADAQRDYVQATGTVSVISTALRTQLRYYAATPAVSAGPYRLRANSQPVSVPAALAPAILAITGLDNAAPVTSIVRPLHPATSGGTSPGTSGGADAPCSSYYGQNTATGQPAMFGTTSFPTVICGYTPAQIRKVYGDTTANPGQGQTIALTQFGLAPSMFPTLRDYAAANSLPAPSPARYSELSLGQGSACATPTFPGEEEVSVEAAYAMASSARLLVVGGDTCDQGWSGMQAIANADTAILNGTGGRPLASIVANPWLGGFENQPAALTSAEHAILVRAAAEGVGMYFASGDVSGVTSPASDPFATAVGGTTLGISGSGQRLFETGWSTDLYAIDSSGAWYILGEEGAAGGGPSQLWRQPAYQKGVVPAALTALPAGDQGGPARSVPDLSAVADPNTGLITGMLEPSQANGGALTYVQFTGGGTIVAAPIVAAMVAVAQQGQPRPFGFVNPVLYRLAKTTAFYDTLPLTAASPVGYRGVYCPASTFGVCYAGPYLARFDNQSAADSNYTGQVTLPGYDNMTGLGSIGPDFVRLLRSTEK